MAVGTSGPLQCQADPGVNAVDLLDELWFPLGSVSVTVTRGVAFGFLLPL